MTDSESTSSGGANKVLKLYRTRRQYRGHSGTQDEDFIVEFLFSLSLEGATGVEPFWCEVHMKKNLRERPGWKDRAEEVWIKAAYRFAVESLKKSGGRPTRHLDMNWLPETEYAEGPPLSWDLGPLDLNNIKPVVFDDEGISPVVVDQH